MSDDRQQHGSAWLDVDQPEPGAPITEVSAALLGTELEQPVLEWRDRRPPTDSEKYRRTRAHLAAELKAHRGQWCRIDDSMADSLGGHHGLWQRLRLEHDDLELVVAEGSPWARAVEPPAPQPRRRWWQRRPRPGTPA